MSASHDDDDDLELEPIDPEILEHERRRAQQKSDDALARVDFEDVFHEKESEPLVGVEQLKQFRFTIKHLLLATAVLAIVLTLFQVTEHFCSAIAILFTATLAGGWAYVFRRERALKAEKERLRAEFEAGRRLTTPAPPPPDAPPESPAFEFRFAFSAKQMLIALTVAAVMMGVLSLAASKGTVAMILGMIAILGLVASAVGFEPPAIFVLGWWLLLVCYLILGLWLAIRGDGTACREQAPPPLAVVCGPGDCPPHESTSSAPDRLPAASEPWA
ncbi:MAG: hypothetical protein KF847_17365 [Pirellulales bacterium]|nr:hypothetical protein [Pirellulales bacterium]